MRPRARWVVRAEDAGQGWRVGAPQQWDALRHMAQVLRPGAAAVVLGMDVPLGAPRAWASRAGVQSFRELMRMVRDDHWPHLLQPAEIASQLSVHRPFYPARPGGARRQHLVDGLGLDDAAQLLRACDRPLPGVMGSAAPVFWLVGAQQVGKAAISAWREVVAPAAALPHVRLWPFDGPLRGVVAPGTAVIAEAYPRAAYEWPLGFPARGWSKRRQADRALRGSEALRWVAGCGMPVHLHRDMRAALRDGFGSAAWGEDAFDATMGALQVIAALEGLVPAEPPGMASGGDDDVHPVEGWILGRPASPLPAA